MAVKGASQDYGIKEIFSKPRTSIDTKGRHNSKAAKYGLKPHIVGTHKAKDEIERRLKLTGYGRDRFHYYDKVPIDYYDHLVAEVKAPHRSIRNKMVWQLRAGKRNEALDCEVYAMHASRARKVHLLNEAQWSVLESKLTQTELFEAQTEKPKDPEPSKEQQSRRQRRGAASLNVGKWSDYDVKQFNPGIIYCWRYR